MKPQIIMVIICKTKALKSRVTVTMATIPNWNDYYPVCWITNKTRSLSRILFMYRRCIQTLLLFSWFTEICTISHEPGLSQFQSAEVTQGHPIGEGKKAFSSLQLESLCTPVCCYPSLNLIMGGLPQERMREAKSAAKRCIEEKSATLGRSAVERETIIWSRRSLMYDTRLVKEALGVGILGLTMCLS